MNPAPIGAVYCPRCKTVCDLSDFKRNEKKRNKLDSWCRNCHRLYDTIRRRAQGIKEKKVQSVEDRFWQKVKKADNCWLWQSHINGAGYGSFIAHKHETTKMAHRLSWELTFGPIPARLCVLHRCDNKLCVNPEHLFLGTHKDNTRDMHNKGRWHPGNTRGNRNGRAKLNQVTVNSIRSLYRKGNIYQYQLADKFGVSQALISAIVIGKVWRGEKDDHR